MGGFSHAALTTPERFYTLCLKTEKILLSETAGRSVQQLSFVGFLRSTKQKKREAPTERRKRHKAVCDASGAVSRVVSLLPEFILTNALKMPIFFRQYGTQGPTFEGAFVAGGLLSGADCSLSASLLP